ncbi:MAG: hybrid sensor histidine kinase/response regulator [Oscillochloridaceae bacterium]|nr:hybrid sensor histidine kinase/response regulator [Chloroflexaceae bacterium]MDW8390006.1 hybrid sensor histidine kinase/response regulator [Oscillochloridaceae bacterium]
MDLAAFHQQFREEAVENVRVLQDGLLALETETDAGARRATVDRIFRAMHTIKGSARVLGFEPIGRLAHALENLLGELRQDRRAFDRPLADALLRGGDAILALSDAAVAGRAPSLNVEALIASLPPPSGGPVSAPGSTAPPASTPAADPASNVPPVAPAPPARAARQTVRVRVDRLDRMLNLAGELVVSQQMLADYADELRALHAAVERQLRALNQLEAELARLRFSPMQRQALDRSLAAAREAGAQASLLAQRQTERFSRHASQHEMLVRDIEQEVMAARLLPIATVFGSLPRAVRDLAQATGKQVRLSLYGETVELDRKVLEAIADPLLHLVRNAVDHGIETPEERQAAGKAPQGRLTIRAEAASSEVHVVVSDDGRGIDPQLLREHAVRRGVVTAESAARLPDHEALELIFAPGFSTASVITDISGRGVGMDVVRQNLAELGGRVEVESHPGKGTSVTLILPLTLVTTHVLLVRVGRDTFALPASACRGAIWVDRQQVRSLEGQPILEHEGRMVAVLQLAHLLGIESPATVPGNGRTPAVLTGGAQRPVALLVDELLDEREVVIKPLGTLLAPQRRFSGAVQLGDGNLVLLLNLAHLMQPGRNIALDTSTVTRRARRLLVADDSFATRELIRSMLQSAGYDVVVAVDGMDALEALRSEPIDLVVSDIEMPRLNGFELVTRIRAEPRFHHLPVVLVTSLASEEHRRRGLEVGAQAYIVKSQFDQQSLLEVVRRLLGDGR